MRKFAFLFAVSIILLGTESIVPLVANDALARPGTRSFSCHSLQDFVYDRGAVVMNTKSSSVFRRFVADRSYCDFDKVTRRFRVPTRDGSCTLLICKDPIFRRHD